MAESRYKADIGGGSLKLPESRIIAGLLLDGVTEDQWRHAIEVENVLQRRSPGTAKRQSSLMRNRLETMGPELWQMVRDGSTQVAIQAVFAAAIKHSTLLGDFLDLVVRDQFRMFRPDLPKKMWDQFLEQCRNRDTALGMAALLPHSKISYSDKGDVLVDGQSSAAGNRSNILATKKGVAVKADDLKDMKKDAGREFVKPYEVVYVYHNTIDAIGDSGPTEGKTFEAVRQALTELSDLIRMIMNNLNGTYIYVTADHGFLFQETALDASDKNALTDKPAGALTAKKRYLLGRNLPDSAKAYHGSTAITAGADGDMEFWVPKGNNRFHFVGGSRFVHGGAMLQEITVPLIRVRQIKGDAKSKRTFGDAIDKFFKLGNNLNQRDTIAVRRTVSGLLKLLYPHEGYDKDAVRRCLEYALETRRRVKEQLKKIGGMEFYDVHFSYIDMESMEEKWISVPEQGGGKIIPEGPLKPGVLHTVATGAAAHLGLYRFETQVTAGNGKLTTSGLGSSSGAKEAVKVAFDYFKANLTRVSGVSKAGDHDFHLHTVELHNTGAAKAMTLASFVAFCSAIIQKPLQSQMVVLGDMSLGGSVVPVENLAECLQVAFDSGAKRILIPMSSAADIPTIPAELFAKFQTSFYSDPVDAVFKALGVD